MSLSKRSMHRNRTPFCHTLRTHLISYHGIFSLSAEEVMTARREAIRDLPTYMFQRCFQQLYQSCQTIEMMIIIIKDQLRTINLIITHLSKNPRKGPTATILREGVDLFKCTSCSAASCEIHVLLCAYSPGVSFKT